VDQAGVAIERVLLAQCLLDQAPALSFVHSLASSPHSSNATGLPRSEEFIKIGIYEETGIFAGQVSSGGSVRTRQSRQFLPLIYADEADLRLDQLVRPLPFSSMMKEHEQ